MLLRAPHRRRRRRADARRTIGVSLQPRLHVPATLSAPPMYRFKSKADGDLIMMAPVGDQILRIIGREPAPKGIIEVGGAAGGDRRARAGDRGRRAGARRGAQGRRRRRSRRRQRDRPAAARLAAARDDAALARRARRHRLGRLIRAGPARDHRSEDTMKLWSDSWANGERIPAALRVPAGSTPPRGVDLLRQPQPAPGVERPAGGDEVAGR